MDGAATADALFLPAGISASVAGGRGKDLTLNFAPSYTAIVRELCIPARVRYCREVDMNRPSRRGFTLVELLVVIVIIALLAALLLPAIMKALCSAREGVMKSMFSQLKNAATMYENDNGAYPPSNVAFESNMLVKALKKTGSRRESYFEFKEDMLDENENLRSRVIPDDMVWYRNNQATIRTNEKDPDAHNKKTFDLWCQNCAKEPKGCNNWSD